MPVMPVMPKSQRTIAPPESAGTPPGLSAGQLRWGLAVLGATLVYPVLESGLWSRTLWGAHALAFLPAAWRLVPAALSLLFVPRLARAIGDRLERWRPGPGALAWAPWLAGLVAAAGFWLV